MTQSLDPKNSNPALNNLAANFYNDLLRQSDVHRNDIILPPDQLISYQGRDLVRFLLHTTNPLLLATGIRLGNNQVDMNLSSDITHALQKLRQISKTPYGTDWVVNHLGRH